MQSKAKDVTAYLAEVPEERRAALEQLRKLCLTHLKGFEESMDYGGPSYKRNGVVEVGFMSQKHFIGLYILKQDVFKAHADSLKLPGISLGKGVIRYSRPEKIDFNVVKQLLVGTYKSKEPIC
jgi:uncharacterized protein YdhG (YjbR/CyaY superfamily)